MHSEHAQAVLHRDVFHVLGNDKGSPAQVHAHRYILHRDLAFRKKATYNPWGKPGSGAPLRQADGALVTNVK